jgi:hypothetical protein
MPRSTKKISIPAAITVIAVGVIALISSGALRPAPVTGGTPSKPPVATPSTPATPAPSAPAPTQKPDDVVDGEKSVELDVADPNRVYVGFKDFTGSVVDATSGRAGDGMSVRWYELRVQNVDDDTLRLTWVGLPNDDPIKVIVTDLQGTPTIVVFSLLPPSNSDALGFDRVLDLHFEGPVRSEDFDVVIQDGMDTDD